MSEQIDIEQFIENFRGVILQPKNKGYDEARTIYNAMIDKRPGIIARYADIAGVITAVKFGVENRVDTTRWCQHWSPQAPEDVYAFYLIAEVPSAPPFPEEIHDRKVCGLVWCCTGSQNQADKAIQKSKNVAEPIFEFVGPLPYPMLSSLFDGLYDPGLHWYWKGNFFRDISDNAIEVHQQFGNVPTSLSTMHLYPIDAAVHKVDQDATAWSFRDVNWFIVIGGVDLYPKNKGIITSWARDYWDALHPHSAGASYINFMRDGGQNRIQSSYGGNYACLKEVKKIFDPDNFFHINQNIVPD